MGHRVKRWTCEIVINWSWPQILLGAKLRYNLGQVVHTYVPLCSITWYLTPPPQILPLDLGAMALGASISSQATPSGAAPVGRSNRYTLWAANGRYSR